MPTLGASSVMAAFRDFPAGPSAGISGVLAPRYRTIIRARPWGDKTVENSSLHWCEKTAPIMVAKTMIELPKSQEVSMLSISCSLSSHGMYAK